MAKRSKTFSGNLAETLDETAIEPISIERILGELPIAGDDILADLLAATSERTVEPSKLAVAEIIPDPEAVQTAPLPEGLGEETGATPEYVQKVEEIRQKGRSLAEAEEIAKRHIPEPSADTQAIQTENNDAPKTEIPIERPPLTEMDSQLNAIAAEELVEWYDIIQSVTSVWAYDFFSTPKKAVQTVEELYPKIAAGKANPGEKALYEKAQEAVLGFTKRKTVFAEQVAMSQGLKQRTVRLLDKILEARQVRISPELLLGFLLLTPLVVNGGKILLEKIGFENADSVLDKFTTFVNSQESAFWNEK